MKNAKYNDLQDMVYRTQLTYDELIDILDLKNLPSEETGFSLNPGMYEVADISKVLEPIKNNNLKVSIRIDDIRLKSNSKINQTLRNFKIY